MIKEGDNIPSVKFRERHLGGWIDTNTDMYFKGKKVILFSLPGAFTPTCSSKQLPGFEENAKEFKKYGIDEVYCMSVNDSFVMNAWAQDQKLENVKVIPDGNGEFTSQTGMLCSKRDKCFGDRSWRYAAIINDGVVEKLFVEPGKTDDTPEDPYGESSPENVMKYLQSLNQSNNI
jgi:peroxiredoxin